MKLKKILVGALAALVVVTGTPAASTAVLAANSAQTSTDATPEQEVAVKKPSKVTATAKANAIKVTIKEVDGATGYQIQYSTKKNFSSNKKTVSTKKTSYTVKGLKSKKTYYVRTRAYTKNADGTKIYSKWTTAKTVKTK